MSSTRSDTPQDLELFPELASTGSATLDGNIVIHHGKCHWCLRPALKPLKTLNCPLSPSKGK